MKMHNKCVTISGGLIDFTPASCNVEVGDQVQFYHFSALSLPGPPPMLMAT